MPFMASRPKRALAHPVPEALAHDNDRRVG